MAPFYFTPHDLHAKINRNKEKIMTLREKAFLVAITAHSAVGQKRKYSGEPYIVHPVEVAEIVESVEHTPEMVAAALLHDVVEDTAVSIEMIQSLFGSTVAHLVGWLTDVSKKSDGNRAKRKAMDRAHTHEAPAQAQTIKLADLISNTSDITKADPNFAVVYMKEKRQLLEGMDKADEKLLQRAWGLVIDWENRDRTGKE